MIPISWPSDALIVVVRRGSSRRLVQYFGLERMDEHFYDPTDSVPLAEVPNDAAQPPHIFNCCCRHISDFQTAARRLS